MSVTSHLAFFSLVECLCFRLLSPLLVDKHVSSCFPVSHQCINLPRKNYKSDGQNWEIKKADANENSVTLQIHLSLDSQVEAV